MYISARKVISSFLRNNIAYISFGQTNVTEEFLPHILQFSAILSLFERRSTKFTYMPQFMPHFKGGLPCCALLGSVGIFTVFTSFPLLRNGERNLFPSQKTAAIE